jgi:hypothetical protein
MKRTLTDATVQCWHFGGQGELRRHLQIFLDGYDQTWHLKTLQGLTSYEFISKAWNEHPSSVTGRARAASNAKHRPGRG